MQFFGLFHFLGLAGVLFVLGVFGVLWRKNAIIILMSIELMLTGANLAFVTFSRFMAGHSGYLAMQDLVVQDLSMQGHMFAFMVMVVAACEVAVGLAIIVVIFRNKKTIDIDDMNLLKG